MLELKHHTQSFNLYNYLTGLNNHEFLNHVRYKSVKRNYTQSQIEHSDYIFEVVEGAMKIGFYSGNGNEALFDILMPGDFYGIYLYKNEPFFDLAKALTHVKLRVYEVSYLKHLVLVDQKVAKFFHQNRNFNRNSSKKRLLNVSFYNI